MSREAELETAVGSKSVAFCLVGMAAGRIVRNLSHVWHLSLREANRETRHGTFRFLQEG
jgi:hypothetical protein